MATTDPYEEFASVYDEWQTLYPRPFSLAIAPLVGSAVRTLGVPRPVLADIACGTGTFATWWSRKHPSWKVYGADRSPAMIRRAVQNIARDRRSANKGNLGARGARPEFIVQDLKDLALPEPVGVLTCLFDSLNHVTRTADLRLIFRQAYDALAPGGLFLFDLVDEDGFIGVFTGSSILRGRNLYVGMEMDSVDRRGVCYGEAHFTFFHRLGSRWRRLEFEVQERQWRANEIRSLLASAGLTFIHVHKLDPYDSDEFIVPRTFWVCCRPTRTSRPR